MSDCFSLSSSSDYKLSILYVDNLLLAYPDLLWTISSQSQVFIIYQIINVSILKAYAWEHFQFKD